MANANRGLGMSATVNLCPDIIRQDRDLLLRIVMDLALSKGENLIHVFQSVWVTREREVDQRDAERSDILDGEIRSCLWTSDRSKSPRD